MNIQKQARVQTDQARVEHEAKRVDLSMLCKKIDDAENDHANNAHEVALWAKYHNFMVKRSRASEMAMQVCRWFEGVRDLERMAADLEAHERDKAAFRKRQGRRIGTLRAAIRELEKFHTHGKVTADELKSVSDSINTICTRIQIELPEMDDTPILTQRITVDTQLGSVLMSLLIAVGFGSNHLYSIKRGAEIASKLMRLYGFTMGVQQLQNTASKLRTVKKQ